MFQQEIDVIFTNGLQSLYGVFSCIALREARWHLGYKCDPDIIPVFIIFPLNINLIAAVRQGNCLVEESQIHIKS